MITIVLGTQGGIKSLKETLKNSAENSKNSNEEEL